MVSSITARVNFSRSISGVPGCRAPCFGGDLLLRGGIERQQIQRPEQRGRGGLVTGEDHGRDLVAELLVGKRLAGFGIARGVHQIEQVARRRAVFLPAARRSAISIATKARPALAEARAARNPAASATTAAAPDRADAAAPAARHIPSRNRASVAPWRSMPNENMVRPAISSVMRCIASRRSTGRAVAARSLAIGLVDHRDHMRHQR